jgi:tetratricopeptide (TPR) repeat protein
VNRTIPSLCRLLAVLLCAAFLVTGCTRKPQTRAGDYALAKALFEETSKRFHIPSADAAGAERLRLQKLAEAGYGKVLKLYPAEDYWAAQAARNLGNIYAAQTNVDAAIQQFVQVERNYPRREWEVLMALKSAADLLWENGRFEEARPFYGKIVQQFDRPDSSQVVLTVVRGSKHRLNNATIPSV